MEDDHRTDDTLLALARDDPEAFGDLTAETFAIALANCRRFDPGRGPARGWVFGIAKHVLSESHRRARSATRTRDKLGMQRLSFDDDELERVETLIDLERDELPLTQLVGDLIPEQREAVLARVVDERDYADISAELSVSEHTVRQRVSRGLARLSVLRERRNNA